MSSNAVPADTVAPINVAAMPDSESALVLEACRMRLENLWLRLRERRPLRFPPATSRSRS
jgi:hypothetical protein